MNILSPPSLQHAHTRDFDEQATLLEGWNQHYSQLSSGAFEGAITELVFEDVHLFMEYTSRALYQSGKLDCDTLAVGVPMRHGQGGVFCGTAMKGPAAHIFSGADGFDFYSPTRLLMGGLVVSRHAFQDWLHDRPAVFPDDRARLQTVDPQTLREAGSFLWTVFDLCRRSPQLLERPLFRDRLRNSVFSCLADIADEPGKPANGLSSSQRRSLVQAVRDYVESRPDEPVSIDDVCHDLGISRRTLQYSFQDTLGINPASFIRARRLNKVREMLREGDSVTEAATAWGFWHFGHFSHEYKKLFGELPSDTLRRHHRS